MSVKKVRYYIFLSDVFTLSLTAFGGPQAHIAHFITRFVVKRSYLNEKELLELNALCQILPGPTSTQTVTAIGFKVGGIPLAYLTLLIWCLPAVSIMILAALGLTYFETKWDILHVMRFVQPMAVGFIAYAAYIITSKVIESKSGILVMILSAILSLYVASPFVYPIFLVLGGLTTALKYKKLAKVEEYEPLRIRWDGFFLWGGVFLGSAILGAVTQLKPIILFENFYRNGSMVFGGGQVLIPLLYTEFVEFKHALSSQEFLSGYGFVQAIPGPVFSFSSFVGALSMREYGVAGKIIGGIMSAAGIFLPGTFLIFFVIRFWNSLKQYRIVRASLEGITAASSGMVIAAAIQLFIPLEINIVNPAIVIVTFILLRFTKVPAPLLVVGFILLGALI